MTQARTIGAVRILAGAASVLWAALLVSGVGCGASRPVELPTPDSGTFLTLEEQQALSAGQLQAYCRMLDDYLAGLKEDIALSRAMNDSLTAVLDSLNAEHGALNNETRLLENQLRRMKAQREVATEYTTRAGDTLMNLARLFYGSPQEWRKLYDANKDVIGNPGEPLEPGLRLTIPR